MASMAVVSDKGGSREATPAGQSTALVTGEDSPPRIGGGRSIKHKHPTICTAARTRQLTYSYPARHLLSECLLSFFLAINTRGTCSEKKQIVGLANDT